MKLLSFIKLPIYDQLLLEEELLRTSNDNFCLINAGSSPACVMGISAKPHDVLEPSFFEQTEIKLIKRYSGGGTVIVNEQTLFFTLICNKSQWNTKPFPEPIMRSVEPIIADAIPSCRLYQNDFVIGERKCGGNAQMITRDRFVHHISFVWDFDPFQMAYLKQPEKQPAYRAWRAHNDFMIPLKELMPWDVLQSRLTTSCHRLLGAQPTKLSRQNLPHRASTELVSYNPLRIS
jgi:lipoate-protein ligase A